MFWVFLLSVFGAIAVYVNRERHRELIPYVVAVISVVEMFFLFVMIVHKNPFTTYLTAAPTDGQGLNPLLQNPYMAIHPPSLYTGFVGMTIPYAFGMAALFTGYLDDIWLRAVRRWTMVAWLFLSLGLILGMIWAYEELGWGGFWGWDPVENAGLLPWLTATAFLHSVMVQERRSMLRVWNLVLVIMTFFLTIFATFMTRSGVVQSVHAFGEDKALAWLFTGFMITILVVSFGMLIYRLPLLKSRHELDSWASREAAFMVNNWILLFAAIFVLFATMFPTLSQAVTGQRLTVGPPFFNQWMLPIGLILLLLTGVGPLMAWRKSTVSNMVHQFTWPVLSFVVVTGLVVGFGLRVWTSVLCFGLCAFVAATITQEFIRGTRVRKGATGTDLLTAAVGLVSRSKRRYGGYIIHLAIALIFLGFAGQGFKQDKEVLLKQGQEASLGIYTVRNDGITVTDDGAKQMVTGKMTVFEKGAGSRHPVSGALVLPEARERADDRSRDPAVDRRRPLPGAAVLRPADAEREPAHRHQSAGRLDLVRLRHPGDWHGHRPAARAGVRLRSVAPAGRDGDDGVDRAAGARPVGRHGARTDQRAGDAGHAASGAGVADGAAGRARASARERGDVHVRVPRVGRHLPGRPGLRPLVG